MVKVAISRPEPSTATLNTARWSIAVSSEQGYSVRQQVIDARAIRIQRGGIGVACRKLCGSIAKLRAGRLGEGIDQRLHRRGRILPRTQVRDVGIGNPRLALSGLRRAEEKELSLMMGPPSTPPKSFCRNSGRGRLLGWQTNCWHRHVVAQILKDRAVKTIRAALGHYRYLRARSAAGTPGRRSGLIRNSCSASSETRLLMPPTALVAGS